MFRSYWKWAPLQWKVVCSSKANPELGPSDEGRVNKLTLYNTLVLGKTLLPQLFGTPLPPHTSSRSALAGRSLAAARALSGALQHRSSVGAFCGCAALPGWWELCQALGFPSSLPAELCCCVTAGTKTALGVFLCSVPGLGALRAFFRCCF